MTNAPNTSLEAILDHLTFTRLKIPTLIKRELLEAVKGVDFTPEQFYDYQEKNINNPRNHLYAMIDTASKIHGFLWAEQNGLNNSLFINTFSVDKEYWHKGKFMLQIAPFILELKDKVKATSISLATTNKKFFKKYGFKESKIAIMTYN